MTVITLSRQSGSHGEQVATQVAQALNLRLIDAGTINRAAQRAGVPRIALAELEQEGKRGLASQMLKALRAMPTLRSTTDLDPSPAGEGYLAHPGQPTMTIPFGGLFSTTVPPISASLEGYVRMVDLVIRGLAHEGKVLILGRGGQIILKDHPGTLHIQTVAPLEHRVKVVMERHQLNERDAHNRIRASDRARFDYIRRYHGVDWLDPSLYHMVVNTERIPVASVVDLVIATHQALVQTVDSNGENE